jgi:hypothetical protein
VGARRNVPGLSRRGFLTASAATAAGLGAAGLAAPGAAAAASVTPGSPDLFSSSLSEAVLAAFRTSRLVGLGEAHGLQEHHDLLQTLISDPRLPGVIDDIVVEFGNTLYQDTIDRFVLDGQPVADADLRLVWRNTLSPLETWDELVYEQFFRRVRAGNWTLPPGQRIRVLLGDPPIDWSTITSRQQIVSFLMQRDTHPLRWRNSGCWPRGAGHCCATAQSICSTPLRSQAAGLPWSRSSSSGPGCGLT